MLELPITQVTNLIGNCCFNGSLFAKCKIRGKDKPIFTSVISDDIAKYDIYIAYRATPSVAEGYNSSLHITRLSLKTGKAVRTSNIAIFKEAQREDPRVFCFADSILMTYSNVINRKSPLKIEIWGTKLESDFTVVEPDITFKGLNRLASTQKNWTFFEEIDIIHILYNIMPFEVYLWDQNDEYCILTNRTWHHPERPNLKLRGGTPPIKINSVYYTFVHSTDYEVYCLTFHPSTLAVISVSRDPLLPNRGKKQDIHFPCGCLWNAIEQTFYISLGVDDIKLCFFSIEKYALDELLIPIDTSLTVIRSYFDDPEYVWVNSCGSGADRALLSYLASRNISYRNVVWDRIGSVFPTYMDTKCKKVFVIQSPITSLASMHSYGTLKTNLCKLSCLPHVHFSYTSLIYFMTKQLYEWSNHDDVFLTRFNTDDVSALCERFGFEYTKHIFNHTTNRNLDQYAQNITKHISDEGTLGLKLLDTLESYVASRCY